MLFDEIKQYIDQSIDQMPFLFIYDKLKGKYNDHDIKFVMLTFYDHDLEDDIVTEYQEREKRKYQHFLRKHALKKYGKCVISGIDHELLLEVAHIKPVSECANTEKSDIYNTLLLWIDVHKYFDRYMISINPETCSVETNCDYLKKYDGKKVNLEHPQKKYLSNHHSIFLNKNNQ
jgi:hypothetical protein